MRRALNVPGASVHWYDKSDIKKQRKMGHITITGSSMGIVEAHLKTLLTDEKPADPASPQVGIIMG
ncbi:hypothetical protein PJK47_30760, partial [Mycobacterium kansasii]